MMTLKSHIFNAVSECTEVLQERISRSWQPKPNTWCHETTYKFSNGSEVKLYAPYADSIVFPASPGFSRLLFCRPDDGNPETYDIAQNIKRDPIIGWRAENDGELTPLTVDGPYSASWDRDYVAVQLADAITWLQPKLVQPVSLGQWIGDIRSDWARRIAEKAEREKAEQPCAHCGLTKARDFVRPDLDLEIPF